MYVHQNNQVIAWSLEMAAPSCWKKHVFPFPLEEGVLESDSEFFSRPFITATPAGEILLLTLKGTPSLWVLLDKFGADPVWKEFRIRVLAAIPTGIWKSSEVVVGQNIAQNRFYLD
ncbi:unnamed protein product [Cuscuta epithymum]|uniref:Uncharacterized protein n=1 Tax=Cuscuta epithymum TaxID=186058 RepID=A0AAV0EWF8_9ASTE|nr:unnamed protein product [Cuscuta epithymum]